MPSTMTDAEIAEDRYEQLNGPIDYWAYGVQSVRVQGEPIGPLAVHQTFDVPSRDDALDGLHKLAANTPGGGNEPDWDAFYDAVEAQRGRQIDGLDPEDTLDFDIEAPDGLLYWIEAIDRS